MTAMLHGHTDRVNCVAWVRSDVATAKTGSPLLLSGAADDNVIVWKYADEASSMVCRYVTTPVTNNIKYNSCSSMN